MKPTYEELQAQVERLRELLSVGFMTCESGGKRYQLVVKMPNLDKLQQLHSALVTLPNQHQCLAEVISVAGRAGWLACLKHIGYTQQEWLNDADSYADEIRKKVIK